MDNLKFTIKADEGGLGWHYVLCGVFYCPIPSLTFEKAKFDANEMARKIAEAEEQD